MEPQPLGGAAHYFTSLSFAQESTHLGALGLMDYVDAAPLLDAALRDLASTAHLVRDERYPMLELMSAIEINDPRTDTFLHARQQLPPSGEFDPALQLEYSDSDLLDISNHLLRLEVSRSPSF